MSTENVTLAAGASKKLPGGKFFALLETSYPVDLVFITTNGFELETLKGVQAYTAKGFTDPDKPLISVKISSSIAQTVKIDLSEISPLASNRIEGNIDAEEVIPTDGDCQTDVSLTANNVTTILAANADRKEALITNLDTSDAQIRVAPGANVAAGAGTPLDPGASIRIKTTKVISAYAPAGSTCSAGASWTEK